MMNKCKQCDVDLVFSAEDLAVFERFSVPAAKLCADCGHQRRLAFRNDWNLYKSSCDSCKKSIITFYHPDSDLVVYCPECWWSDKWSATDYGMDYDFEKSLFEQFSELQKKVPLLSNTVINSVNSEYNAFCVDTRNSYKCARVGDSEEVYYSYLVLHCERVMDCYNVSGSQDLYECVDCFNANNCYFSQLCQNSSGLRFCYDMIGCHDCFGSVGLRNVRYYFFNEKCTKEQYEEKLKQYSFASQKNLRGLYEKFYHNFVVQKPIRNDVIINSENSTGNYIQESKDVNYSFDVEKTDTCSDSWGVQYSNDVYRCNFIYYAENCYENISNSKSQNIKFTFCALGGCYNLTYCMLCFNNSHDCFASLSLKHNQYCILNKEYSKEEYEVMVKKIIEHMGGGKDVSPPTEDSISSDSPRLVSNSIEWGEFFPIELSLFAYNETPSQEYFPLSKDEVESIGGRWLYSDKKCYLEQSYEVPDFIGDVGDDILSEILACNDCGKNYKLLRKELEFYRRHKISIPSKCPHCRHLDRVKLRNPKKLWKRNCAKCDLSLESTYEPDRPESLYCKSCYYKDRY